VIELYFVLSGDKFVLLTAPFSVTFSESKGWKNWWEQSLGLESSFGSEEFFQALILELEIVPTITFQLISSAVEVWRFRRLMFIATRGLARFGEMEGEDSSFPITL